MRNTIRVVAALAGFAGVAWAQTGASEPSLIRRIEARARDQVAHLPDYTCLETVDRFHKEGGGRVAHKLEPLDTVQLEVLFSGGHEWFGRPGDRELNERDPSKFIGAGMIANGLFALFVHNILLAHASRFTDAGEELVGGARAHRFDYVLPFALSEQHVALIFGSGKVGLTGSLWVNPVSAELVRLEVHASEIPEYLPLERMDGELDYAPTRIGERVALLPQEARLHVVETPGEENYDRFSFTHCSQFHAESEIRFEVPQALNTEAGGGAVRPRISTLPALLRVPIRLKTQLTPAMAVGDLIEGQVVGDVWLKGVVAVADGTVVRGRLRRLERFRGGEASFVVGLEFTEVALATGPVRFDADLIRVENAAKVRQELKRRVLLPVTVPGREDAHETITLPELAGVAQFFVPGNSPELPAAMTTVWRTRGPLR